jgi:phospholipid N-methyltransferase
MSDVSHRAGLREHVLLFSRFLRSPRTVGALTPSSAVLAESMIEGLDIAHAARVVELGPGTGVFTSAIVRRLGPNTRFLAMDIDPAFVAEIGKRWPGVECVCASAEDLHHLVADRGLAPVDHIVSGLPFVSLPAAMTTNILESIARVLRPGGTMTTFQYVHGYRLPPAVAFRRNMSLRMGGEPQVKAVVRNFPPAFVLTWTRV